jgi:hypothetical protein
MLECEVEYPWYRDQACYRHQLHNARQSVGIACVTCSAKFIDRFHSRDRWPQWGGETIRNI